MAVVEPLGSYDSESQIDASRVNVVRLVDVFGPISPELVLVDPQLAAHARALLPDVGVITPPRIDEPETPARAEPRPAPIGRTIPWRLRGALVLIAMTAASVGLGAWTAVERDDGAAAQRALVENAPTFFSTPPIESDLSPAAIAALEDGVRRTPRSPFAREALGSAYVRLGRWEDAEAEFRALVELSPMDEFARYALGRALMEQGRASEAARQFGVAESLSEG
ncbi:MAG: tetratricopeptide repeat protein [Gaiellaceae bacterium]